MSKKVLILAPFSYPSACGVWTRAFTDAKALKAAGFEVKIFTSNVIKRTGQISGKSEIIEGIEVERFKPFLTIGENAMFWWFWKSFRKFAPDIIHTHLYRHPHSLMAVIFGRLTGKKIFLTTHAPFQKFDERHFVFKIIDFIYDILFGWWSLKLYTKVIRITEWENIFLKRLGLFKSILIGNGINNEFIKNIIGNIAVVNLNGNIELKEHAKPNYSIRYMGRLDPSKRLEWIITCAKNLPEYKFKIYGALSGYANLEPESPNLEIKAEKYNRLDFIKEALESDIFLMPSFREGLPFVAIEALSQGKILITSDIKPFRELIKNGVNGFIVSSEIEMIEKIKWVYNNWNKMKTVREQAIKTGLENSEDISNKKLLELYKKNI